MKINIFGSTGEIGSKSLLILNRYFKDISINILVANKNYKKLAKQAKQYKPKIISLFDDTKISKLKKELSNFKNIKILNYSELNDFLNRSQCDISILSISGNSALLYLESIFNNSINLGLVNKESIISCGHLLKKINKKKINLFPLDSEHYSIFNYLNKNKNFNYSSITLTASGGPFLNKSINKIKNAKLNEVINHPKWKMGYKNSIDSATLANKCLEIIEAHYLFNTSFNKLNIVIHPEALIHSIIEYSNNTSVMNYFYNDMFIPLFNFFSSLKKPSNFQNIDKFKFNNNSQLNFLKVDIKKFPITKIFNELDKNMPTNIIKFNLANEFAVNLFINNKIKFWEIHKYIENSLTINFNFSTNSINSIIEFQREYNKVLSYKYEYL